MNIPKAMKVGGGQTELKLDMVLHATAKKGNENYKNKRHCGHSQQGIFLASSGEGVADGFLHSGQGLLEVRMAVHQALYVVHSSQPLLRVRLSACTAVVHAVRWYCSLFFTAFYIGRWLFIPVFSIDCCANWSIYFLTKPFTYPAKVSRTACGSSCRWQCRTVSQGCSHCGALRALG